MERQSGTPLFCVLTTDKISKRKIYFNFISSDAAPYPEEDITDENIIRAFSVEATGKEQYNIPLRSSPMFWSKIETSDKNEEITPKERFYVIEIQINDKFALRKVLISELIRTYLIIVTMNCIEDKYNKLEKIKKTPGQFLGHEVDFDQEGFEILKDKMFMEKSTEIVYNKITVLDISNDAKETLEKNDSSSWPIYDLYFRPKSKILTCCIRTEKLPDSISFNDDRLIVENDEKKLVDVFLPIYIDLKEPMRYKFDEKLSLLRIVFRTINEPFILQ